MYINPDTPTLLKAKEVFLVEMSKFVQDRVRRLSTLKGIDVSVVECFYDIHISDIIEDILIGKPERLIEIDKDISPLIEASSDVKKGIKHIFKYDLFVEKASTRYDAYQLAESLNIKTCIYCNRNYTSTVFTSDGRKLTRPQFDHYFNKATYPLLAISFYNLIPSCPVCNSSIKGTAEMNLNEYLHPYVDDEIEKIRFTYAYSSDLKSDPKVKIVAPNSLKARNTVEAFALEEIYGSHTSELSDLLKTRQYFSDRYLSLLSSHLLRDVKTSKEEIYRIVFGTEYDESNFIDRPFSKFKNDILKELGII